MDWFDIGFKVFGGLGLFLMGMKIMSESMQKVAGQRLRKILGFLTSNRFMAVFVGFFVTAVIQSSSATTVMVVGFVNATLMSLTQAIGVVLGANIGTTITGWIVSLPIVKWALPIIGVGVLLRFFSKSEKWRYVGEIIFGFGILFLGMTTMKDGFKPLRSHEGFIELFKMVDGADYLSILLGVGIGTITTVLVQSSSATIGISIALASQGLLNFEGAVALILGDNIGTTITAILASIGTSHHAKRAALAHTMFNVLGVCVILILFYPFITAIEHFVPHAADFVISNAAEAAKFNAEIGSKPYIAPHIAMAHSVFNVANVIFFVPLIGVLAKVVTKVIPEPKETGKFEALQFEHVNYNLIGTPALGIVESEKEMAVMSERVRKNSLRIKDLIADSRDIENTVEKIRESEKMIDEYRIMITQFLLSLSQGSLSKEDAFKVGNLISCASNLEKYADYVEHIALAYRKVKEDNLELTETAKNHLQEIVSEIQHEFDEAILVLKGEAIANNRFLERASERKLEIKSKIRDAKVSHFERLKNKTCSGEASMSYIEILSSFDGMTSQVFNVAEAVTNTKFS